MTENLEIRLTRELRAVGGAVLVPPRPPMPVSAPVPTSDRRGGARHWQPLLAAAAVVLVVVGTVTGIGILRDGRAPAPTPPAAPPTSGPTPTPTPVPRSVSTSAPRVPHVLDGRLVVDGRRVPGTWWSVTSAGDAWLGMRRDNTWWWGTGPDAVPLPNSNGDPPVLSPGGRFLAVVRPVADTLVLELVATRAPEEDLGSTPFDTRLGEGGTGRRIRAVTEDGWVVTQGAGPATLWQPSSGTLTTLVGRASEQSILGATTAGLVVIDGASGATDAAAGEPYLATIAEGGVLTRGGVLPQHDGLVVSPAGSRLAWVLPGTLGGEVAEIDALQVGPVEGGPRTTMTPPRGWAFRVETWAWEDEDHLVVGLAPMPPAEDTGRAVEERLARCSVPLEECVLTDP